MACRLGAMLAALLLLLGVPHAEAFAGGGPWRGGSSGRSCVGRRGRGSATSSPSSALRMFTGIVEEMGKVVSLETRGDMELWDGTRGEGTEMVVEAKTMLEGAYLG